MKFGRVSGIGARWGECQFVHYQASQAATDTEIQFWSTELVGTRYTFSKLMNI